MKFSVTLRPGLLDLTAEEDPETGLGVKVLVADEHGFVVLREYVLSPRGGTMSDEVRFPLPADLSPGPWERRFHLWVDPFQEIIERDETNNYATARSGCVLACCHSD